MHNPDYYGHLNSGRYLTGSDSLSSMAMPCDFAAIAVDIARTLTGYSIGRLSN